MNADFNWLLKVVSFGSRMRFINKYVVYFNVTGISSNLLRTFFECLGSIYRWYGLKGVFCHIFWRTVNAISYFASKVWSAGILYFQKPRKA